MRKGRTMRVVLAMAFAVVLAVPGAALAAETDEVTLKAQGMYCSNCEARVVSALSGLDGVESVDADANTETATVVYVPSEVSPEDMVASVNKHTSYLASVQDEADAEADDGADGSAAEASSADGGDDAEVETAVRAPGAASQDEGSLLPTGALAAGGGAVALLVIAGGTWAVARR